MRAAGAAGFRNGDLPNKTLGHKLMEHLRKWGCVRWRLGLV